MINILMMITMMMIILMMMTQLIIQIEGWAVCLIIRRSTSVNIAHCPTVAKFPPYYHDHDDHHHFSLWHSVQVLLGIFRYFEVFGYFWVLWGTLGYFEVLGVSGNPQIGWHNMWPAHYWTSTFTLNQSELLSKETPCFTWWIPKNDCGEHCENKALCSS